MEPWVIVLIVLGSVVIAYLLVSLVSYFIAFYHNDKIDMTYHVLQGPQYDPYHERMIKQIKSAVSIPFEEVKIKSKDGLNLYGRLYIKDPSEPFHIQCHGYHGHALRDFSGGLQIALMSHHNVLLFDHRAHGKSEGRTITFGIKEREDVLCWTNYIINRFGKNTKIFLEGISMGGATVLMCADIGIPNLVGILSDCPYSSPMEITSLVASRKGIPNFFSKGALWLGALLFGHFVLNKASAIKSIKNANVPILIIHGKEDKLVPISMSRKLKEVNPNIMLFEFDNAGHGMSYILDKEKYHKIAINFFDHCLREKDSDVVEKTERL